MPKKLTREDILTRLKIFEDNYNFDRINFKTEFHCTFAPAFRRKAPDDNENMNTNNRKAGVP